MGCDPKDKPDRHRNEGFQGWSDWNWEEQWRVTDWENNERGGCEKENICPHHPTLFYSSVCTVLSNFGLHLALFIQPSCGMPSQTGFQWLINAGLPLPLHNLSPSLAPSFLSSLIFSFSVSKLCSTFLCSYHIVYIVIKHFKDRKNFSLLYYNWVNIRERI